MDKEWPELPPLFIHPSLAEDLSRAEGLSLAVNMAVYEAMAKVALEPDLLRPYLRLPAKPLNRRQKARRFLANVKQTRLQRLHDWTTKQGAYCDSDY